MTIVLSTLEKTLIATGLLLAKDYLEVTTNLSEDGKFDLALTIARLVNKLEIDKEHSKACAETASFSKVVREAAWKVKNEA